jgi:peptidoglycan/xylan/chitin deacetylase (PgdA/CDA1 family)
VALFSRSRMKRLFYRLLWVSRVHHLYLHRLRRGGATVVLNLHRVSPHPNPFYPPLHPRDFEDLLIFVKRHFAVCVFHELEAAGPKPGSSRPALVLSFDDGYHDFIEYALPLLDRHHLSANQNVIGACVAGGEPPWNILLYDFLNQAPRALIDELHVPGFTAHTPGNDADSKLRFSLALVRFLKTRPCAQRNALWPPIQSVMDKLDFRKTRMMNAAQVREVSCRVEIGAESFSHESMGLESEPFFVEDFRKAEALFSDTLGLPLTIYAFPNGSYAPWQIEHLRAKGVRQVLLVEEKFNRAGAAPIYARITLSAQSAEEAFFHTVGFKSRGRFESYCAVPPR